MLQETKQQVVHVRYKSNNDLRTIDSNFSFDTFYHDDLLSFQKQSIHVYNSKCAFFDSLFACNYNFNQFNHYRPYLWFFFSVFADDELYFPLLNTGCDLSVWHLFCCDHSGKGLLCFPSIIWLMSCDK